MVVVSKMSPKRKNAVLVVGLFLVVILFGLVLYRPSASTVLGVGFAGYTNGQTGERLARFAITNQSRMTIRRWGDFDREVRNLPRMAYTRTIGSQVVLSPGQAEVVLVPLDAEPTLTYQKDWRAVFYWRREDLKTRFDVWADTSLYVPAWLKGRGVRVYRAPSRWMDK